MKRYQDWATREHGPGHWWVTLILAGLLIVLTIPLLVVVPSLAIDRWLSLPDFYLGTLNLILNIVLAVLGFAFALWSIYAQITIGMGTPVPMLPTKKLVVQAPFTYCRNPMTLGTILVYLGVCVWIGSFSALAIVLILTTLLLLYIKFIEEKELTLRFGEDYLAYKRRTPFIIPRKPQA